MERFAFLVHPLSLEDVYRKFRLARCLPDGLIHSLLKLSPPLKMAEIKGIRSPLAEIQGCFIAVMLTPQQMLQLPEGWVLDKIVQAGKAAEEMGARVLGLGAYTSMVGNGGKDAALRLNIPATSGNSLTAATAIAAVVPAAALMDVDLKNAEVVVVGTGRIDCPGAVIARATAPILAGRLSRIRLLGREGEGLKRTAGELQGRFREISVEPTTRVAESLRSADVVLMAAGSSELLVQPEDIKPGAIVCDIARPRDTSELIGRARDDVLIIDGGLWEVPGDVSFGLDFGLPPCLTYPCVAETMVLTLEGRYENYSLGKDLDSGKIVEIFQLALKHGFRLAALRSGERALEESRCLQIRERARRGAVKAGSESGSSAAER